METRKIVRVRSADTKFPKIDIHTHILPKELPKWKDKFGVGGFIHLDHKPNGCAHMMRDDGKFFREIEANCWDAKTRVEEFDPHGVRLQVLSTVPVMFNYWTKPEHGNDIARFLNDHLAETLRSQPGRFAALCTVPLQNPDLAIAELERCMRHMGFSGVQIGSHVNDWNLNHDALFPFFEAAQDMGAAVFVHPWDMMGEKRMPDYWLPWLVGMPAELSLAICSMIFGGIFERLPKLRVAFAHGGGAFASTLGRIEHGFRSRPDLCAVDNPFPPSKYMGKFFVDSLVHDPAVLNHILSVFGENRVLLGTDYPFPLGEKHPGELISSMAEISEETRKKLYFTNALEWLGASEIQLGI